MIPYYIEKKLVKLEHHHQALFYKKTDLLKLCEPILNDNPILREALYLKNNLVKQNLANNHSLKKKIKYYKFNRNNLQVFNLVVDLLYGTKNNKYSLDENFFSINNLNSFFLKNTNAGEVLMRVALIKTNYFLLNDLMLNMIAQLL